MAMNPELFALQQGIRIENFKKNNLLQTLKQKQSGRGMLSNLALLGLTIGTGGAGLPALLSKIPAFAKVIQAVPSLGKLMTVLDATKKTSRLGVFGTNMLNNVIHRSIADAIVPDVYSDKETSQAKLKAYGTDIAGQAAAYGKSWLPGPGGAAPVNPYTQLPWGQETLHTRGLSGMTESILSGSDKSNIGDIISKLHEGKEFPNMGNVAQTAVGAVKPTVDPRDIVSMLGKDYATTPEVTKGLFGNPITQKPSGYSGGNPYYELMNMISD